MTIVSTGNLIRALCQYQLLTADQEQQLDRAAVRRLEPRLLAKQMAQRGWLTIYQINQLLAGRAEELVIGPYRILDKLGEGGLSQVFKARHAEWELTVALKVIRPEVLSNQEGRQQFLLEIEAMARLDHPNIIQFCDADQIGDRCYFAMEFVEGTDLGKHVRLSGPMPVPQACDYIRQAALGLQHAHERNLVHRDIKPVNLFLTQTPAEPAPVVRGQQGPVVKPRRMKPLVKILDWGLASLRCPANGEPQVFNNIARNLIGTADYLSPEQACNANTVDIRGDIYSLGCTFYYLLTGQPPFPDGTLMQKVLQHQMHQPRPVEAFRQDMPPEVSVVLQRMLAKDPNERFRTPAALAVELAPFAQCPSVNKVEPPSAAPKAPPVSTRRDDTPLPIALGGQPNEPPQRLPRAGQGRGAERGDTAFP